MKEQLQNLEFKTQKLYKEIDKEKQAMDDEKRFHLESIQQLTEFLQEHCLSEQCRANVLIELDKMKNFTIFNMLTIDN